MKFVSIHCSKSLPKTETPPPFRKVGLLCFFAYDHDQPSGFRDDDQSGCKPPRMVQNPNPNGNKKLRVNAELGEKSQTLPQSGGIVKFNTGVVCQRQASGVPCLASFFGTRRLSLFPSATGISPGRKVAIKNLAEAKTGVRIAQAIYASEATPPWSCFFKRCTCRPI
jgi:hypothetical protein